MASGDAQRAWFPEMLADLKQRWLSREMTWDELAVLCREMTEQRESIKKLRDIKPFSGTCKACGGKLVLPSISIRSVLFALRKTGVIEDDHFKKLERDWKKHRRMNGLDVYGNKLKS